MPRHSSIGGQPPAPSSVLAAVLAAAAAQAAAQPDAASQPRGAAETETGETGEEGGSAEEAGHVPAPGAIRSASAMGAEEDPVYNPPRVMHHRRAFSDGAALMRQPRTQQQRDTYPEPQDRGSGLLVRISDLLERPVHVRPACSATASGRPSGCWAAPPAHAGPSEAIWTSEISATDPEDEGLNGGRRLHLLTGVSAGGLLPRRTRRRYFSHASMPFAGPHCAPPTGGVDARQSGANTGSAAQLSASCAFRSPLSTTTSARGRRKSGANAPAELL